jgi:hypothetical protein
MFKLPISKYKNVAPKIIKKEVILLIINYLEILIEYEFKKSKY